MTFGRKVGGGRRFAARERLILRVDVKTRALYQSHVLTELSCTGAKLRGVDLPAKGRDVFIDIGPLSAFASVVWRAGDECGVQFDVPLGKEEVKRLKREHRAALSIADPDAMLATEDWMSGLAR